MTTRWISLKFFLSYRIFDIWLIPESNDFFLCYLYHSKTDLVLTMRVLCYELNFEGSLKQQLHIFGIPGLFWTFLTTYFTSTKLTCFDFQISVFEVGIENLKNSSLCMFCITKVNTQGTYLFPLQDLILFLSKFPHVNLKFAKKFF